MLLLLCFIRFLPSAWTLSEHYDNDHADYYSKLCVLPLTCVHPAGQGLLWSPTPSRRPICLRGGVPLCSGLGSAQYGIRYYAGYRATPPPASPPRHLQAPRALAVPRRGRGRGGYNSTRAAPVAGVLKPPNGAGRVAAKGHTGTVLPPLNPPPRHSVRHGKRTPPCPEVYVRVSNAAKLHEAVMTLEPGP